MGLTMRLLLASLAGLLMLFQYGTMSKFQRLSASVSYLSLDRYAQMVQDHVGLEATDAVWLALIVAICLAVLVLELTRTQLTQFLRSVFASERSTIVLLLASSVVFVRYYLGTGNFNWAADSSQHIAYVDMAARSLAEGELPLWTYYFGTGSPYFQFYGFIFFWLAGAVQLLVGDTYLSLKLVLTACHVISGLGAYAVARASGCRRGAAFVAGIGFVLCFWHAQQVLIMGRLQLSVVYALLPWPIWALERAFARPGYVPALFGGALLGVLVLAHPSYGYWACAFTGLYGLVRLLSARKLNLRNLGLLALLLGTGLAVGAALVLPMWLEKTHTGLGDRVYNLLGTPDPSWWHVLVWSNFRFWLWPPSAEQFNWYGGYLGLSLIGLSMWAMVIAVREFSSRRTSSTLAVAVCLLGALLMVFGYRTALVRLLPNSEILGAGRYLLFASLFLALGAGHGVRFVQVWARRHRYEWQRVASLGILLVVVDLGPTTFQQTYNDPNRSTDAAGVPVEFYEGLASQSREFENRGELPDFRVLWAMDMNLYHSTALLYFSTHTPTPNGPHPGELRSVFRFVRPLIRLANASVASSLQGSSTQPQLDPTIYAGLTLLDVGYLLARSDSGETLGLELPDPSPIYVSSRLAPSPVSSPEALSQMLDMDLGRLLATSDSRDMAGMTSVLSWVQGMGVNTAMHTCRTFFADDVEQLVDLGTSVGVTVLDHAVRAQQVDLRVRTASHCFARLAYGYFPFVEIRVDGALVQPRVSSAGFVVLELQEGEHDIELRPRLSTLRASLLWMSLLLVCGITGFYIRRRGEIIQP
jgi:hypothetical protein